MAAEAIGKHTLECLETVPDLVAINPSEHRFNASECYVVLGYHAKGDGGGGIFYWDPTSSAADDGGLVIEPNNHIGNGRWLRMVTSPGVNVRWFGAKGDGIAIDTQAIRHAIESQTQTGKRGIVFFPSGTYAVHDTLTITQSTITLQGEGANASSILYRHKGDSGGPDCLVFAGWMAQISVIPYTHLFGTCASKQI